MVFMGRVPTVLLRARLTAGLKTALREQSELAWTSPTEHAEFDAYGPLEQENPTPLLLDANGGDLDIRVALNQSEHRAFLTRVR